MATNTPFPFERLPIELRLRIWHLARDNELSRIIQITIEPTIGQLVSLSPAPPLLQVCRDARLELLHSYPRIPTASGAPPVYADVHTDTIFVREDRGGALTMQNHLLRSLIGTNTTTPLWDVSGVKHLAVDYWVLKAAHHNLAPLTGFRGIQSFLVMLANHTPEIRRNPLHSAPQTSSTSYTKPVLTNVGFHGTDIRRAVRDFWGVIGSRRLTSVSEDVRNAVAFDIPAEIFRLLQLDPSWAIPAYNVVSYGLF